MGNLFRHSLEILCYILRFRSILRNLVVLEANQLSEIIEYVRMSNLD